MAFNLEPKLKAASSLLTLLFSVSPHHFNLLADPVQLLSLPIISSRTDMFGPVKID